uniref:Uncharacterized protein n=1 Tax=Tanacetum cinerariifolium TaxID=118510 RepID=A0A6L2MJ96_TANCI|nr:hypothetical protein [Tanacetum cinerariifolium]
MVSATEDPLTFNDLMATPINFSKYVLNRLKIDNLTQDLLLGPAYNLLKGTCSSNIELEYKFQESFNALIDKLDWNNPKGDHYRFDMSKPLPLQGYPSHLTVAADYFFNNDLEYLKSSNPERTILDFSFGIQRRDVKEKVDGNRQKEIEAYGRVDWSFAYRASPSTNPNPMISLAFVEENYDVLESLLRKRQRQIRNEDLQTKLEYFSEDYDEEREMEPRPKPNREATPTLRPRSPMVRRKRERIMGFKEAPNREGSRRGRNAEGENVPPNGTLLSHHAQPFIPRSLHTPIGLVPIYVNPYSQPFVGLVNEKTLNFPSKPRLVIPILGKSLPIIHTKGIGHKPSPEMTIRSLVEHLATDLPTTYKGLMKKYTWIKAREVVTNGTPNDQRENFKRSRKSYRDDNRGQKDRDRFSPYRGPSYRLLSTLSKSPREILATEKAARSFEQPPCMFGSRWS